MTMMKAFIRGENKRERDHIDNLMKSFSDSINLSLQRHKEEITSLYEKKIKMVEEKITAVHKLAEETIHTASNGYVLATQNIKIISDHISNNDESINALRAELYKLQSNLDDNINRSMRANLIFEGIPEDEAFSSYEETRKVISNFIGSNLNIDGKSVSETIVRAHRSNGRPNQNGHPRNIFVKFARDDIALKLHNDFTDIARNNPNTTYKCNQ